MSLLVAIITPTTPRITAYALVRNAVRAQTHGTRGSGSFLRKGVLAGPEGWEHSGLGGDGSQAWRRERAGVVSTLGRPRLPGPRPAAEAGCPGQKGTETGAKPWLKKADGLWCGPPFPAPPIVRDI